MVKSRAGASGERADDLPGLRVDLASPELASLRKAVREHYEHLLHAQEQNELIAIDLAELLRDRLDQLLAMAHQFALEARLDIVGVALFRRGPV